jgi:asparagine synthase (glutamine-hydrolysing)
MANEDRTVWVVHNGEIYNHAHLRRELEAAGHRFASTCDTEAIVHAYEEWGDAHVHRLRGMFAYAVYDRRAADRPRLLLVRDRLGIKPLHYGWDGRRLVFASEPKAILAVPDLDRRPDVGALADYLVHQYVPAPATAWRGIRKLGPGETLTFEAGRLRIGGWWDLEPTPDGDGPTADEAARSVLRHLDDAVVAHLMADVPIGVFLSGGIDSGAVAAAVAAAVSARSTEPATAFTVGFDVEAHSELVEAAEVAAGLGLPHETRRVRNDDVPAALDRMVAMYDEPFGDGSAVPTRRVSELARGTVKVALSGDGGDEVFGGYGRYARWVRSLRLDAAPARVRRLVAGAARSIPSGRLAVLEEADRDPLERYARLATLFTPAQLHAVAGPALRDVLDDGHDPLAHLRRWWRPDLDPITRVQYLDLKTYLPDDILTKVDRAAMSVGLELRPPLLDHRLVEYVLSLPSGVRLPGREPKGLLKRAMEGRLPRQVLERRKKGFSAPWDAWMGSLDDWAAGELRAGAAVRAGILAPEALAALDGGRGSHVWSLLVLERWCRSHT